MKKLTDIDKRVYEVENYLIGENIPYTICNEGYHIMIHSIGINYYPTTMNICDKKNRSIGYGKKKLFKMLKNKHS